MTEGDSPLASEPAATPSTPPESEPYVPGGYVPQDDPPKRKPGRPKGSKNLPGSEKTRKGPKSKATVTREIEKTLTSILQSPAIAFQVTGDAFCAENIMNTAPALAKHLAEMSESYPLVRKYLLASSEGGYVVMLVLSVVGFIYPSLAHHGILPTIPALQIAGINVPTEANVLRAEMEAAKKAEEWEQQTADELAHWNSIHEDPDVIRENE